MLSIYEDVGNWEINRSYNLYDIYKYNGLYYYAITRHNAGSVFNPAFSDGVIEYNGRNQQYFFWKPSYNSDIEIKPAIKKRSFLKAMPNAPLMVLIQRYYQ